MQGASKVEMVAFEITEPSFQSHHLAPALTSAVERRWGWLWPAPCFSDTSLLSKLNGTSGKRLISVFASSGNPRVLSV